MKEGLRSAAEQDPGWGCVGLCLSVPGVYCACLRSNQVGHEAQVVRVLVEE